MLEVCIIIDTNNFAIETLPKSQASQQRLMNYHRKNVRAMFKNKKAIEPVQTTNFLFSKIKSKATQTQACSDRYQVGIRLHTKSWQKSPKERMPSTGTLQKQTRLVSQSLNIKNRFLQKQLICKRKLSSYEQRNTKSNIFAYLEERTSLFRGQLANQSNSVNFVRKNSMLKKLESENGTGKARQGLSDIITQRIVFLEQKLQKAEIFHKIYAQKQKYKNPYLKKINRRLKDSNFILQAHEREDECGPWSEDGSVKNKSIGAINSTDRKE